MSSSQDLMPDSQESELRSPNPNSWLDWKQKHQLPSPIMDSHGSLMISLWHHYGIGFAIFWLLSIITWCWIHGPLLMGSLLAVSLPPRQLSAFDSWGSFSGATDRCLVMTYLEFLVDIQWLHIRIGIYLQAVRTILYHSHIYCPSWYPILSAAHTTSYHPNTKKTPRAYMKKVLSWFVWKYGTPKSIGFG